MTLRALFALSAAIIMAPLAPAWAAPQVLGLIASNGPVPLACFGGECAAELGAFCLQQARDVPEPGTRYRVAGRNFSLIAVAQDGRGQRLPGADYLTVTAARGFAAVRVSVSRQALAALGAVRASVEVGERVSLVPLPVAGDPDPLSETEIAAATGALREIGRRIVDDAPLTDTMRLTSRGLNALPERGWIDPAEGEALWREALRQSGADDAAIDRADAVYGQCIETLDNGHMFSLRRCLEWMHDRALRDLNIEYWQSVAGS